MPIVRRQTRFLLYRLAVPGPPLSRDHLCFLFWPDVAESKATRNLSHLLTHLRQALPHAETLVTADDQVYLEPEMTWSDVAEFLRLRDVRDGCDAARLARAVELYRGPFLDGVYAAHSPDYEAWMMLERRTLERRYRDTLLALVDAFSHCGKYERAIRYANRYLATDRLDETIHRRLIELHMARGDRAAALRQYRQCEAVLEQELGVHPLPETRAVYESVYEGRNSTPNRPSSAMHWTTLPGPRVPLVGRAEAWEELNRHYAQASEGKGSVILVTGEAGIGKSRLLEQFVAQSPSRALVAAGQQGAESLPFHVLIQAIRPQLRIDERTGRVLNARLEDMSPVWLAEASHLLPELGGDTRIARRPHLSGLAQGDHRPQLYECLSRFVLALASDVRPSLICLDNLDWVDCETLEWLSYFALQLRDIPVLVLAACRNRRSARLELLCHGLMRQQLLAEVALGGLTTAEVAEILRQMLDDEPQEALASRLRATTGGNPFSVIQIVLALLESGLPPDRWVDAKEWPMPVSLCAAVEERLDALDPVTRQVIEACAILSPALSFDLIRLTSGRRELETLDALEKLVEQRVLLCQGEEYRFRQGILLRVLKNRMSPMRRQLLHRRAGRALEQTNRHAVDALARHYEAGAEPAKAAHFRALAAQRAEALFAMQQDDRGNGSSLALPAH